MRKTAILLICLFAIKSFAQEASSLTAEFDRKYKNHFSLNSESLYLHLNKSAVLPDENIWFSVYAYYNEYNEPSRATQNVHVALYDEAGRLKNSKIIYSGENSGSGFFQLGPENYPPGKYFIRASTRHMDNFNEDYSFVGEFEIVDPEKQTGKKEGFEVHIQPEGGKLIAGVENNLGLSLVDEKGKTHFFSGKVLKEGGETVAAFKSSPAGLAKLSLLPGHDDKFFVEVTTPTGKIEKKAVPAARAEGFALSFERTPFGEFVFKVKTNENTFKKYQNRPLLFAAHQEGKLKTKEFFLTDSLQAELEFSRRVMFPGTNIISIFNADREPLLERLVYNSDEVFQRQVKATLTEIANDSVEIELSASNFPQNHRLSLSVLPADTEAYSPDHNLLSAFLMRPYVRGSKIDAAPFFQNVSKRFPAYSDLDLLLLMQGSSRYSWQNILNEQQEEKYAAEAGFTIEGKVKDKIKMNRYKLAIIAPEQNLYEFAPLQKDGSFSLSNVFLLENTPLTFSLVNEDNEKTFRPALDYKILPEKIKSDVPKDILLGLSDNRSMILTNEHSAVALDTVPLEHKKIPKASTTLSREEEDLRSFRLVTDYLRNKGFLIHRNQGNVQIFSQKSTLEQIHGPAPVITVNGVRVPPSDLSSIVNLSTDQVESIEVKKSGAGMGFEGGGGWIAIKTRKDAEGGALTSGGGQRTKTGFAPDKPFTSPKEENLSAEEFSLYAPLAWFPNLQLKNAKTRIKVPLKNQRGVRLLLEGITEEGALISEDILLMIPEEKL